MKRLKHIVVVSLFALSTFLCNGMTVSAKSNVSNWSFNFDLGGCIGKNNGKYHSLDKGTVVISGKWIMQNSAYPREDELYVELKRVGLLVDKNFGTVNTGSASTSDYGGIYVEYTVDKDSDKYYLKWVCMADYVDKVGSGTIYNK